MGGNLIFTPVLQAPIVLSNPTGQIAVVGQGGLGGAFSAITPTSGAAGYTGAAPSQILRVPVPGTGGIVAQGNIAAVVSGLVNRRGPLVGGLSLLGTPSTIAVSASTSTVGARFAKMKGHYAHYNNYKWPPGTANQSNQQKDFNSKIGGHVADVNMRGSLIYFRYSDACSSQGDYSQIDAMITYCKNAVTTAAANAGRNLTTNPYYLIFIGPQLRTFATDGGVTSGAWPTYLQNQNPVGVLPTGWDSTIPVNQQTVANSNSAQFSFQTPAMTDLQNILAHIGDTWGNDDMIAAFGVHDESAFIVGGSFAISPTTVDAVWTGLNKHLLQHLGSVFLFARINFFGVNTNAPLFFDTLVGVKPSVMFGGPDPGLRLTTAMQYFMGMISGYGDKRGVYAWCDMTQGTYNGGGIKGQQFDLVPNVTNARCSLGPVANLPAYITSETFWAGMGRTTSAGSDPTPPASAAGGTAVFYGTSYHPVHNDYNMHSYILQWNDNGSLVNRFSSHGTTTDYPNGTIASDTVTMKDIIDALQGKTQTDIPTSMQ